MSTRTEVIYMCDLCGDEESQRGDGEPQDSITTHTVTIDGVARELEACDPCWGGLVAAAERFLEAGRKPEPQRRKKSTRGAHQ